ncbi:unnamed protein product [Acanthoscelides obtectus]|uniref:CHK kinase-like domain-containing protein n=1 Tax=Acanthoscelides obtectus TaxID=200917 RepID=A0A9P0LT65_ACAOB|nr:unnamed protein product [Acanthoscelides obtectus]CAK1638594.1 hypothetical protein AOBTE_LOCUS10690 [Acanthoscelides obtectus]
MSDTIPEIKKIDELVEHVIESDKKVKDVEVSRLTSPGENYGSCMLKVDITLERKSDSSTELLHTVAKLIPEVEFLREAFQVQKTVKTEIAFYDKVVPSLQDFQREYGIANVIDCFPKLYASRLNLKEDSDEVDEDAVLLFENLSVKGFKNINRIEGFDLEGAKIVLKDLAGLHAVPLALRLQKPHVYEENVKKFFHARELPQPPKNEPDGPKPEDTFLEICKDSEECAPYMTEVDKILTYFKEHPQALHKTIPPNKIWATLSHGDMWVNNTMQRFEEGKILENKFVDFQLYTSDTPVKDLLFFLWSSCQLGVLQGHLEDLLKYYHASFIKILEELGCNVTPYSYEKFILEAEQVAVRTTFRALFFSMFVVQAKKREGDIGHRPELNVKKEDVNPLLQKKIAYAISYYGKKNLLKVDL